MQHSRNEDSSVNKKYSTCISISDLPFANDMDSETQQSIRGGRMKLDDEALEKKDIVVTGSAGGHPLDSRFGNSIWNASDFAHMASTAAD